LFIFSSIDEQHIHSDELEDYVYSTGSILLITFAFIFNAIGGIIVYQVLRSFDKIQERIKQLNYDLAPAANNTSQIARTENNEVMAKVDILSYRWSAVPLVYFSFFASFFGTLSNTMLRGLVIIVDDDFLNHDDGDEKFGVAQMIILIIINIVLMIVSLVYLNKCLQYFDTIYIIPMVKVFTLMNTIICGGVVYKEFDEYGPGDAAGMAVGTFL
jgi:hypothetical protein